MEPELFLQTIYLGDRACKAVLIDSWAKRVAIQINVISRIRPRAKPWDFYTEADIADQRHLGKVGAFSRPACVLVRALNRLCRQPRRNNGGFDSNRGPANSLRRPCSTKR